MPSGTTSGFKAVEPGDFVISLRTFQGGIEYSTVSGLVSPAYTVVRPQVKLEPRFYRHYFKSREFIGRLAVAVIGIRDGKQISYDDFRALRVPEPPPAQQEKIADMLDAADAEIRQLVGLLSALQAQKRALADKLLTGQIRQSVPEES